MILKRRRSLARKNCLTSPSSIGEKGRRALSSKPIQARLPSSVAGEIARQTQPQRFGEVQASSRVSGVQRRLETWRRLGVAGQASSIKPGTALAFKIFPVHHGWRPRIIHLALAVPSPRFSDTSEPARRLRVSASSQHSEPLQADDRRQLVTANSPVMHDAIHGPQRGSTTHPQTPELTIAWQTRSIASRLCRLTVLDLQAQTKSISKINRGTAAIHSTLPCASNGGYQRPIARWPVVLSPQTTMGGRGGPSNGPRVASCAHQPPCWWSLPSRPRSRTPPDPAKNSDVPTH